LDHFRSKKNLTKKMEKEIDDDPQLGEEEEEEVSPILPDEYDGEDPDPLAKRSRCAASSSSSSSSSSSFLSALLSAEYSLTADNDHRAEFAKYARPFAVQLPSDLEFMFLDAECLSARIRNDMDDPMADHTPVAISNPGPASKIPVGRSKRRSPDTFAIGPVIKLYGVTADGKSVCVDVYGFYPSFRLQIVGGTASDACMARVRTYIEGTVLAPKGAMHAPKGVAFPAANQTDKPRNVVSSSMIRAYSAFPYRPEPSTFFEYGLARPYHVRTMAEHFVKVTELDDDYSVGGVLVVRPHSGEDALTQFMVGSGISGFGWISIKAPDNPFDTKRSESEACPCNFTGDCTRTSVAPIDGRDIIAAMRVLGVDIECIKDEGMPDPHTHPIIIIGASICTAVNGIVDPGTIHNIVFTWFPPGSGGVADIPSAHHVRTSSLFLSFFLQ
jgi:hypothetical protein